MEFENKKFYPNKNDEAWPDGCPSCGEKLEFYEEPFDEDEAHFWAFECGCTVNYHELDGIEIEDMCPEWYSYLLQAITICKDEKVV